MSVRGSVDFTLCSSWQTCHVFVAALNASNVFHVHLMTIH